jgi:hypothetical protein
MCGARPLCARAANASFGRERVFAQIAETSHLELEANSTADGCVARLPTGAPGHERNLTDDCSGAGPDNTLIPSRGHDHLPMPADARSTHHLQPT